MMDDDDEACVWRVKSARALFSAIIIITGRTHSPLHTPPHTPTNPPTRTQLSMPGMMDTVLNCGLNDELVDGLADQVNERFAWDCYRRLQQMFGDVVLGIEHAEFEAELNAVKAAAGARFDIEMSAAHLRELVGRYKEVYKRNGKALPDDPWEQVGCCVVCCVCGGGCWRCVVPVHLAFCCRCVLRGCSCLCAATTRPSSLSASRELTPLAPTPTHNPPATPQLRMAIDAVFRSWNIPRAVKYREINKISGLRGTAVNVQAMVYGNVNDASGTGVLFTRNPATGADELFGEFLLNAQGEDVVAGIRTPMPIALLRERMPGIYAELHDTVKMLEAHMHDMQVWLCAA